MAIEVIAEFDDALLQFVCGVDTDVAEHGPGYLKIHVGAMSWSETHYFCR